MTEDQSRLGNGDPEEPKDHVSEDAEQVTDAGQPDAGTEGGDAAVSVDADEAAASSTRLAMIFARSPRAGLVAVVAAAAFALVAVALAATTMSVRNDASEMQMAAESTISGLEEELAASEDEVARLAGLLDQAAGDLTAAEREVVSREREIEELRAAYDPIMRQEWEDEVEEEIERACALAEDDVDADVVDLIEYDADWEPVAELDDVVDAVAACAEEERSRTEEEREEARLAACESVDRGQLERDPSAYEGQCLHMFARIVQFDSNTGSCSFHAVISAQRESRVFNYDVRSAFGYGPVPELSSLIDDCPDLDGVSNNDIVEVWATGIGIYRYSTTIGGSASVPAFDIEKVELVESRD